MANEETQLKEGRSRLVRLLHLRHLGLDPDQGGQGEGAYRSNEANTANALEHVLGKRLERSQKNIGGDWVSRGAGGAVDKVYDDCSPPRHAFFETQFDNFRASLKRHTSQKSGIHVVVVDVRNRDLTPDQIKRVLSVIKELSPGERKKVLLLVNEDGHAPR
ncbi:hypothetical protein RGUI_3257 [Rhodovulum sp. P5]|uniref:hypothetical protein n=1 Tax=Rhodovulum sp. P5 TaxID=1564506 RepID=UPI0009C22E3A|nr:hypothetical protein [Rhodovulum sp. P5]ARE41398.1 hypothetical protein RGUI_3257 [Rhodovulum sp. P5]